MKFFSVSLDGVELRLYGIIEVLVYGWQMVYIMSREEVLGIIMGFLEDFIF